MNTYKLPKPVLLILSFFLLFCSYPKYSFAQRDANDKERLKIAIEKGKQFFKTIQKPNGAIRDSLNPLFDTWETILATLAMVDNPSDTADLSIKKALSFLKYNENAVGLICHNQKCKEGYCLETTAMYFQLLMKLGDTSIKEKCQWICAKQQENGVWAVGNPDVRQQKEYPSVSAFVMATLQKLGIKAPFADKSLQWIAAQQNTEGHWGNAWEYYNCPAYALWACMMAFENINTPPQYFDLKLRAVAYMVSQELPDGSWEFRDINHPKMPSKELQTALMLNALAYVDYDKHIETIKRGINFVSTQQLNNGSWYGGYFPINSLNYNKHEYIFATALSIIALQKHLDYLNSK